MPLDLLLQQAAQEQDLHRVLSQVQEAALSYHKPTPFKASLVSVKTLIALRVKTRIKYTYNSKIESLIYPKNLQTLFQYRINPRKLLENLHLTSPMASSTVVPSCMY